MTEITFAITGFDLGAVAFHGIEKDVETLDGYTAKVAV